MRSSRLHVYNTARIRKRLQESRGWKRKVGWTEKEANRLKMRRKISREKCGEFYVQVFTSFLEERS